MSFSTSGAVIDSFYLAASVMLMVAESLGASTISADSSKGLMSSAATTLKSKIDTIFSNNSWSSIKAVKHSTNKLASYFPTYATRTSTSITGTSTSGSGITGNSLKGLLDGSGTSYQAYWAACMSAIIPYINYKFSLMSDTNYNTLCNAVISNGGYSSYTQTNTSIQ